MLQCLALLLLACGCLPKQYGMPPPTHGFHTGLNRSMKPNGP